MSSSHAKAVDPATRHAVETFVARVAAQYPLHDAILFGSRARGEALPDSDADVAVILDGPDGSFLASATFTP